LADVVWKDDVYLGARDLLKAFKVSLHASGVWRIAQVETLDDPTETQIA
jgi:hypothetical protein